MARINRMFKLRLKAGVGMGNGVQAIIARVKAMVGAKINSICEAVDGRMGSLMNSLIPSAMGWRRPIGPTTLGPLRLCI